MPHQPAIRLIFRALFGIVLLNIPASGQVVRGTPPARVGFSGTGLGTSGRGVINPFDFSLSPHASLGNIGDTAPKPAADTHGLRSNEAYARLRDVKRILGDAGPVAAHPPRGPIGPECMKTRCGNL